MIKVFLSRELSKKSPFHHLAKDEFTIYAQSLIEFSSIKINNIPSAEWYFFYSRNGVRFFFENMEAGNLKLESVPKIACMGYGTREEFEKYSNNPVSFTGSGKPVQVATQFRQKLNRLDKIVFFTAADSLHSVGKILSAEFKCIQIEVYRNKVRNSFNIPKCDVYIFTSPKNAEAFYKRYTPDSTNKIISIGKSTARSLHRNSVQEVIISPKPYEQDMLNAMLMII